METDTINLLSERINALSESETIAMAKKARELASTGVDVINLSLGEPDFQTPAHIKEAAKRAIDDGYTFYTPVPGYPELRQAIVDKLKRDNDLDYKTENIVVSTGAKQCLANLMLCLVNPGDEVIVFTPYWVTYREIIKLSGGKAVFLESSIENDFKISPEDLRAAITPNTKAILYSSPCNPTGSVYSKEELQEIAGIVAQHEHIIVIADEIYEYINFTGKHETIAQFETIKDRVIIVNGVSKGFAMTGWRLGYMAAPRQIACACDKMQGQFTSGACSIAQKAAVEALTGDMLPTKDMAAAFLRRRDMVLALVKDIPGIKSYVPQGAFYLFPDMSFYFGRRSGEYTIKNANDLCMYLLNDAHVSLVPGNAFGAPDCVRFSFAASDEKLKDAIERIKNSLEKLE
ncbi:MAG: pyridoxal phosphate-dependent aminotransferase [Cytophagales bacterium]|nr:pyridoxal phosphate-dependent aminotransferase [Cytophagales bacterium]